MNREKTEVTFEINEHIGVISTSKAGWNKEVNLVSWNGGVSKYDIRDWDPEHKNCSKGITLYDFEAEELVRLISERIS